MHDRPRAHPCRARGIVLALTLAAFAGCSNDDPEDAPLADPGTLPRLSGTVLNRLNGEPIRDAEISTSPPTEVVTSRADGTFTIVDASGEGGEYRVFANHIGYDGDVQTVNVPAGAAGRVTLQLDPIVVGLRPFPASLTIDRRLSSASFRLTSTVADTGFTISSVEPWLSATPARGTLADGEIVPIEVRVRRAELPAAAAGRRVRGELVINSDNGLEGSVVEVLVDVEGVPPEERQRDCRRPDLFRIGFGDSALDSADLIQFPESPTLPADAGPRGLLVPPPTPLLVDSFVLEQIGTVSVTHVADGPERTLLDVLELDLDERIVVRASDLDGEGRASVSIALLPGVYCYVLRAADDRPFDPPVEIRMELGFIGP